MTIKEKAKILHEHTVVRGQKLFQLTPNTLHNSSSTGPETNSISETETRECIRSLKAKAQKHRQEAAVLDVLAEDLEDSLHEPA